MTKHGEKGWITITIDSRENPLITIDSRENPLRSRQREVHTATK